MRRIALFGLLAAARCAAAQSAAAPADLVALASNAGIGKSLAAWCRGSFDPARKAAYAVAAPSFAREGRYLVLGLGKKAIELAPYSGGADLACYSPQQARELDKSLATDTLVRGAVSPRWNSTVICGFVEATSAVCWQYSPAERAFVKVGGWVT